MLFDVVEPQEPTRSRHVKGAVPHRDAVRLIETAGDYDDTVSFVVTVAIHHRMHLAGILRSDEYSPLRTDCHRTGVLHFLGKHVRLKPRPATPAEA